MMNLITSIDLNLQSQKSMNGVVIILSASQVLKYCLLGLAVLAPCLLLSSDPAIYLL